MSELELREMFLSACRVEADVHAKAYRHPNPVIQEYVSKYLVSEQSVEALVSEKIKQIGREWNV